MNPLRDVRLRIRQALLERWMIANRFERQVGPLDGCHNEWTLVSAVDDDQQAASPELVALAIDAIGRTAAHDVTPLVERGLDEQALVWPGEHYRLLPVLAEVFGARRVVEIGTWRGESAVAFLVAPGVERVDTFDIVPWSLVDGTVLGDDDFGERLTQHLGDLSVPRVFAEHAALLGDADLVFVDGPKDGHFESELLARLCALRRSRPQLVLLDDIKVMTMVRVWRELPPPKLDITSFAHWSGTGLLLLPADTSPG